MKSHKLIFLAAMITWVSALFYVTVIDPKETVIAWAEMLVFLSPYAFLCFLVKSKLSERRAYVGAVGKLVCLLGIVVSPVVSGFGYGILFFPLYLLQWLVLIAVTAFAFFTYLWKAIADRN